jgi:hypothetical protein
VTPDAAGEAWRLRLLYAATGGGIGTLLPYLVLLLVDRGLSPSAAGVVMGLMSGVGVLVIGLWGRLADGPTGVVRALRWSFGLAAAAALVMLVVGRSGALLVVCALLLAAARAPHEALSDTLTVASRTGAAAYGRVRMWASAGFAVTVGGWGLVLEHTGLWLVLPAYAAACLVAVASTRGMTSSPRGPTTPTPAGGARLMTPRVLVLLAGVLVFGVAMGTTFTVLPLRVVDLGGAVAVVGASSVVGAAAEIPLMHRSAWLAARVGARSAVLIGGSMFAVALLLYGTLTSPWALVAVSALRGGGYALVYVGLVTSVRHAVPVDLQARGQALLQTVLMGVAPIAGSSLGGVGYSHVAPALLFGSAAVLALAGTALACSRWADARAGSPDDVAPSGVQA